MASDIVYHLLQQTVDFENKSSECRLLSSHKTIDEARDAAERVYDAKCQGVEQVSTPLDEADEENNGIMFKLEGRCVPLITIALVTCRLFHLSRLV
jgi:hypothetical protein